MRDHKRGAPLHELIHCLLDQLLCSGVYRACRFIQNQHRRVVDHRPRNRDLLPLSCRKIDLVIQNRIISLGKRAHKVVQANRLAGFFYHIIRHVLFVVNDVFAYRPFKKPCILQYHAESGVHLLPGHSAYGNAVNQYFPAIDFVKAHQQVDKRCFSRARRADDGYFLPGLYLSGKVFYYYFVRTLIAESHILKFHRSRGLGGRIFFVLFALHLLRVQKLKYAFSCGCRHLQPLRQLGNLRDGLCKQAHIHQKCYDYPKRDRAGKR